MRSLSSEARRVPAGDPPTSFKGERTPEWSSLRRRVGGGTEQFLLEAHSVWLDSFNAENIYRGTVRAVYMGVSIKHFALL